MKFCTMESKQLKDKVIVKDNEVMAAVVLDRDTLNQTTKKPARLVESSDYTKYVPRVLRKVGNRLTYQHQNEVVYLTEKQVKQMEKARKRARKERRKSR